jgi:glycosyltransferase involved in cell wall biosynthesis
MRGRILFLAPQPFYVERGSSHRTLCTVTALAELGYEIDLICFGEGQDLAIKNVKFYRVAKLPFCRETPIGMSLRKVLQDILLTLRALFLSCRYRYVALHAIEETVFAAALISWLRRLPYIMDSYSELSLPIESLLGKKTPAESHAKLPRPIFGGKFLARSLWSAVAGASALISSGNALTFRRDQPVCNLKGIPLSSRVVTNNDSADRLRKRYRLNDRKIVLFAGNFDADDGVELLLRAFAELVSSERLSRDDLAGLSLLIAGGSSDKQHLMRYRKLALHLKIEDRAIFTATSPGEYFSSFVELAALIICPRISGKHPSLKLYSYLTAGKPLIVTNIPAHVSVVDDKTAFVAEPTIAGLSESMRTVLSSELHDALQVADKTTRAAKLGSEIEQSTAFRDALAGIYQRAIDGGKDQPLPWQNPLGLLREADRSLERIEEFSVVSWRWLRNRMRRALKAVLMGLATVTTSGLDLLCCETVTEQLVLLAGFVQ